MGSGGHQVGMPQKRLRKNLRLAQKLPHEGQPDKQSALLM